MPISGLYMLLQLIFNQLKIELQFLIIKKCVKMEENKEVKTIDIESYNLKINQKREVEKEEKIVNLIIEIILSTTLKEYYEKSNKIP
ncbi:hypothetical protein [Empedobacter brevis]|uniref:hypothetical protein n=1 Tax=Empedobacter brevis TaxID=247 RepID=UPI0028D43DB4|nr:hypothetical protein [Empedobacter brevis]